jgi:hypothetical protein
MRGLRISLIVITRFGMAIRGYGIVITPRVESRWTAPWLARSWSSEVLRFLV